MRAAARAAAALAAAIALGGLIGCGWRTRALDIVNSLAPMVATVAAMLAAVAVAGRDRACALLAAVALVGAGARIMPEYRRAIPRAAVRDGGSVTIVTHNVRFDNRAPDLTAETLAASGADVLLLQETDRIDWQARPAFAAFPHRSRCRPIGCSLLILSRWPITATRYRFRDSDGRQIGPRLVWATIAPPGRPPFTVATLHLDWPLPTGPQQAERDDLAGAIARTSADRLIVAGDFNLTPWSWALPRLDAAMTPMVRATRAIFSWPARIGAGAALPIALLPLDQLYAGPSWRIAGAERLARTGSDHYPIRVRLVARTDDGGTRGR